ncbi:MAG: hypothetical protein ACT6FG_00495 [Methanosarcinaceae archaeon]
MEPTKVDMTAWEYVEGGYSRIINSDEMQVNVLLLVGHGLPGHWDNIEGCAELSIRMGVNPTITERIYFSSHPDFRGEVTGEYYSSDGISSDVGEIWPVDQINLIDPATMNDGDETNDDAMKAFIEKYVLQINFDDELSAAQNENFCIRP